MIELKNNERDVEKKLERQFSKETHILLIYQPFYVSTNSARGEKQSVLRMRLYCCLLNVSCVCVIWSE